MRALTDPSGTTKQTGESVRRSLTRTEPMRSPKTSVIRSCNAEKRGSVLRQRLRLIVELELAGARVAQRLALVLGE